MCACSGVGLLWGASAAKRDMIFVSWGPEHVLTPFVGYLYKRECVSISRSPTFNLTYLWVLLNLEFPSLESFVNPTFTRNTSEHQSANTEKECRSPSMPSSTLSALTFADLSLRKELKRWVLRLLKVLTRHGPKKKKKKKKKKKNMGQI